MEMMIFVWKGSSDQIMLPCSRIIVPVASLLSSHIYPIVLLLSLQITVVNCPFSAAVIQYCESGMIILMIFFHPNKQQSINCVLLDGPKQM